MSSTRSFFACAAVGDSVFVAGGHDNTRLALASAERYDLASNTWETLPRMHIVRDECVGAVLEPCWQGNSLPSVGTRQRRSASMSRASRSTTPSIGPSYR
ncbi:F-box/kelch-repeat protein SKIP20-like [Physcomitrium patens]|uniref:F-box/kelch-repeat protein SKIP20-like n=1 Tax=Physcomitrium patens TaxID=3218 RepID=UPI003CCDBA66